MLAHKVLLGAECLALRWCDDVRSDVANDTHTLILIPPTTPRKTRAGCDYAHGSPSLSITDKRDVSKRAFAAAQ